MKKAPKSPSDRGITVGTVVGDLTVTEFVKFGVRNSMHWRCVCACGVSLHLRGSELITLSGKKPRTTCGNHHSSAQVAWEQERARQMTKWPAGFRYGSKLRTSWGNMINRCTKPTATHWHNYGGRGITVCSEWLSYASFLEWALVNGYEEHLTLERVDVNGNYEPSNCTWIPAPLQAKNRRDNVYLTAKGETKTLTDWALDPRCEINVSSLHTRLAKGMSVEDAIFAPNGCSNGRRKTQTGAAHV